MQIQQEQFVAIIAAILASRGNVEPFNAVRDAERIIEIVVAKRHGRTDEKRFGPPLGGKR